MSERITTTIKGKYWQRVPDTTMNEIKQILQHNTELQLLLIPDEIT